MFFKFYNNVDKIFSHNDDLELPMLIWNSRKMLFITFFGFYLLNRCKIGSIIWELVCETLYLHPNSTK